ncbi:hypothetical protein GCM10020331_086610 [Ectobacillus funiculus]
MLAVLGFAMIFRVYVFLIMTRRMSALIALMLIPVLFALIGGFSSDLGAMMLEGVQKVGSYRDYANICYFVLWNYD